MKTRIELDGDDLCKMIDAWLFGRGLRLVGTISFSVAPASAETNSQTGWDIRATAEVEQK